MVALMNADEIPECDQMEDDFIAKAMQMDDEDEDEDENEGEEGQEKKSKKKQKGINSLPLKANKISQITFFFSSFSF